MAIQAVILDISETLLNKQQQLVPGARALISQLTYWNVDVFFATNNYSYAASLQKMSGLGSSKFLYPDKVGGRKGTQQFVRYVCAYLKIMPNNILYLGDAVHDFYEASHSDVLFFLALWANPTSHCGVSVHTPAEFVDIVQAFFLKDALWYYSVEEKDGLGRDVVVRALLDSDIPKMTGIAPFLKAQGKTSLRPIKGFPGDRYLSLHLLASIYLEGLHVRGGSGKILWCLYPRHDGQYGSVPDSFIVMISRLFREHYQPQLIMRHTDAPSSSQTRIRHGLPTLDTQLQTVHLHPAMRTGILRKSIIVIDDFTTDAFGFETARNFLFNAGAGSVISIAIGKYGTTYDAFYPKPGVHWDSFRPSSLGSADFHFTRMPSRMDNNALEHFVIP